MFAAILALAQVAAANVALDVKTASDGYQIDVRESFDENELQQIQTRFIALGKATCGGMTLRWGRFTYDTQHTADGASLIVNMVQRFECIDPATDPYKPVPADWKATEADERASKAAAERYVRAVLANDARTGIAMYEPFAEVDETAWRKAAGVMPDAGTGSFEVKRIDWMVNPETMAHPGAYVTYVMVGQYSKLAEMCGVLILYRTPGGEFQITQQMLNGVTRAAVESGQITQAQAASYCGG